MPVPAQSCISGLICPDLPPVIRDECDALMDAVREICPDFVGDPREDGAWHFVPACRLDASTQRNLLTLWANTRSLWVDIRYPDGVRGRERFVAADLPLLRHRIAARYMHLQEL